MKRTIGFLLALVCLAAVSPFARADHWEGKDGWKVTFTSAGKLDSTFHTSEYSDSVRGMQPGDDITFTITLNSENPEKTDWYMTNEVIHSLEDRSRRSAKGGAYSYTLRYVGPTQTRVLYDSDTVGGESVSAAGQGLHEATHALKNYFYLDTLASGQSGRIMLSVALDGESQGNRYQDTLADLKMNFAVELHSDRSVVRTGDDTRLLPLCAAAILSGTGLLALAAAELRGRRKGKRAK